MIRAVENIESYCMCCKRHFDKTKLQIINIPEMGYGSYFDGESTKIQLCPKCYEKSKENCKNIWSMSVKELIDSQGENWGEEFLYEAEMLAYISSLPLESRELIYNRFNSGWNADHKMKPQDWIDYELKLLPHDKCKEYGLYSHDEINAYTERFPTCEYPINRIYADGSKGCWCPFGATGGVDQTLNCNICASCYNCTQYKKRETPRKDILNEDWKDYKLFIQSSVRMQELQKKFKNIG